MVFGANTPTKDNLTSNFNPEIWKLHKPKESMIRDKYAMTFMMVGFVDIVMFFVDIGLICISIAILILFIE